MENTEENFELVMGKVEELLFLPGAPTKDSAIRGFAKGLLRNIDREKLDWLFERLAESWERFESVASALAIYRTHPAFSTWTAREEWGPKPTIQCDKCSDWGVICDDTGKPTEFCACPAGIGLSKVSPDFIELARSGKVSAGKIFGLVN